MAKRILITGASGLIGSRLTELLVKEGYGISHLGRYAKQGSVSSFVWNVEEGKIDAEALREVDTVINLAGAGVADLRWTTSRKQLILESRIKSCALLYEALRNTQHQVKTFITASAIGYYGCETDEVCTEDSPPGQDFLADVVRQWEQEADKISQLGIRLVKLRIGIVLSSQGGALMEMARPVRWWVGSPLGSGNQYLTWIHIDDLCRMFLKAATDQTMSGVYNAVGPQWVTNHMMMKTMAEVLHKPFFLPPVPGFMLRFILGQMADIILSGSKVSSSKIQQTGFDFRFRELEPALANLLLK